MLILLKEEDKQPLYMQIYRQIRDQITAGQLPPGQRLPSTRSLSAELAVGRNTIESAYAQLAVEGYVASRPGSGHIVQKIPQLALAPRPGTAPKARPVPPPPPAADGLLCDFQYGHLDARDFPLNLWRRLTAQALAELSPEDFSVYGSGKGDYSLRWEICQYLRRARGVQCAPDQVMLCAGTTCALGFLGQLLLPLHRHVAVEDPGYPNARDTFSKCGFAVLPVPVEKDGLDVAALYSSGARVVYTTPSHQFPTGAVMSIQKRRRLLHWARQTGGLIIEDDYDSEFRYHTRPVPSIASIQPDAQVIYMGTLSKILSPGLRASYLVLPPALAARYEQQFDDHPASVPIIEQKVLQLFLGSEQWEAHLRRACTANRKKHDLLIQCLKEALPHFTIHGENAGLHILLQAPPPLGENALISRAREQGVRVYPVSRYWMNRQRYSGDMVLLGFGSLTEQQIRQGVARLAQAWGGQ